METNIGKLTATLIEAEVEKIQSLIERLNANINPATQLTPDDVHIRCMYIVSEELNSYGGKFPLDQLYNIKELIIDSPVLIGHKKDQLPIGRNFHAEVVNKDGQNWVKSYFYWMKSDDSADDLLKNIDGGIIKECSIGFTFLLPECSICASDIRTCRHEPFGEYTINGKSQSCFFYYKEIDRVLETSLVYRGAIPNTSISNDLLIVSENVKMLTPEKLLSLDSLHDNTSYLLTPSYVGLDVYLTTTHDSIQLSTIDNKPLPKQLLKKYFREYPKNLKKHFGQLIGFRGKERCSLEELQKFIAGEKSIVKRIELRLLPAFSVYKSNSKNIQAMRYKIVRKNEIDKASLSIMTKDGVRVWSLLNSTPTDTCFLYNPLSKSQEKTEYSISYDFEGNLILSILSAHEEIHYRIKRFKQERLYAGKRFLVEKIQNVPNASRKKSAHNSGTLLLYSQSQNRTELKLDGHILGHLFICPIVLNGKEQFQLYARTQSV